MTKERWEQRASIRSFTAARVSHKRTIYFDRNTKAQLHFSPWMPPLPSIQKKVEKYPTKPAFLAMPIPKKGLVSQIANDMDSYSLEKSSISIVKGDK